MNKDISLQNSNLYLTGFGLDSNGNRVVKLSFPNARGFFNTNKWCFKRNSFYWKRIIKKRYSRTY
jgi:hypothetical protein